jgi:hypothetical protein
MSGLWKVALCRTNGVLWETNRNFLSRMENRGELNIGHASSPSREEFEWLWAAFQTNSRDL